MVYKRTGGKSLYFQPRLKNGTFKQLSTGTPSKPLAQRIVAMWDSLALEHRRGTCWSMYSPAKCRSGGCMTCG